MAPPEENHTNGVEVKIQEDTAGAVNGHALARRPRNMTSTEEIDSTIFRPGSVKINATGAFIVDPDTATPAVASAKNGATTGAAGPNGRSSPPHHETSDIRLPNHTAVVSHIAIDVSLRTCLHSLCRGLPLLTR